MSTELQSDLPRERPADRYGDVHRPVLRRRAITVTFVLFLLAAFTFAGWVAVERANRQVNWTDTGFTIKDDGHADVTFQVSMQKGWIAVCSVRAVNASLTEVGRVDIGVGPSNGDIIEVTAALLTSEQATGGGVKACVRR